MPLTDDEMRYSSGRETRQTARLPARNHPVESAGCELDKAGIIQRRSDGGLVTLGIMPRVGLLRVLELFELLEPTRAAQYAQALFLSSSRRLLEKRQTAIKQLANLLSKRLSHNFTGQV